MRVNIAAVAMLSIPFQKEGNLFCADDQHFKEIPESIDINGTNFVLTEIDAEENESNENQYWGHYVQRVV